MLKQARETHVSRNAPAGFLAGALSAALILVACASSLRPEKAGAARWEYAVLSTNYRIIGGRGVVDYVWQAPDGGFARNSMQQLNKDLGGSGEDASSAAILNLAGRLGWELVDYEISTPVIEQTRQLWWFRRRAD